MLLLLYNTYPEHLVLYSIFAGSYMLVDKNNLMTSRKIFLKFSCWARNHYKECIVIQLPFLAVWVQVHNNRITIM